MLLGAGPMMGERPPPSSYVNSASVGGGGGSSVNITVPSGAQKDDLCFIWGLGTSVSVSGGAGGSWANLGSGSLFIFWKKLATADLGATLTITGAGGLTSEPVLITVYRGGDLLTLRAENPSGSSPISYAGLTKSRVSRGLIALCGQIPGAISVTGVPAHFTDRGTTTAGGVGALDLADASAYVDGASMSWTFTGGGSASIEFLEIT